MAGCQMIDVLRRGQHYHEAFADYCRRTRHHSHGAELRQALSVVGRHEAWLAHCIQSYAANMPAGVARAWFKVAPDNEAAALLHGATLRDDMDPDEAVALALACDECLARVFRHLADVATTPELREALEGLTDMERAEEKRLVHQFEHV